MTFYFSIKGPICPCRGSHGIACRQDHPSTVGPGEGKCPKRIRRLVDTLSSFTAKLDGLKIKDAVMARETMMACTHNGVAVAEATLRRLDMDFQLTDVSRRYHHRTRRSSDFDGISALFVEWSPYLMHGGPTARVVL